jgi:hypothetical protein
MSFAALSAESRIKSRLQDLNMSAVALAKLAGIPASRLNLGLNNLREFSISDAERLLGLTKTLQECRDAFAPLPLSTKDPEQLRNLLDHMEHNNITPADIRQIVQRIFNGK